MHLLKTLRTNNAPYITKNLRTTIMKRSQLEKTHWKNLTKMFYVSRLYKKETKMFFNSLNPSVASDDRK